MEQSVQSRMREHAKPTMPFQQWVPLRAFQSYSSKLKWSTPLKSSWTVQPLSVIKAAPEEIWSVPSTLSKAEVLFDLFRN